MVFAYKDPEGYRCHKCAADFVTQPDHGFRPCIIERKERKRWSDFYWPDEYTMPPGICPHCGDLIWLEDCLRVVGVIPEPTPLHRALGFEQGTDRIVPSFRLIEWHACWRELDRYLAMGAQRLVRDLRDRARAGWIARRCLLQMNEPYHRAAWEKLDPATAKSEQSSQVRRGRVLEFLAALTDSEDEQESVMKAEWLRELGRWEEALAPLQKEYQDHGAADWAEQLEELIESRQACPLLLTARREYSRKLSPARLQELAAADAQMAAKRAQEAAERAAKHQRYMSHKAAAAARTCPREFLKFVERTPRCSWHTAQGFLPEDITRVLTATIAAYDWPPDEVPIALAAALTQLHVALTSAALAPQLSAFCASHRVLLEFLRDALQGTTGSAWSYRVRPPAQPPRWA